MRYLSLFSGIEAASVAWEPLGWEPVCFAEIDEFPSALLAERYPEVPNVGDVTKMNWKKYRGKVDLVVGGSPCQSFSIAGKREGLQGESGLMYEYIRAVREIRPRWFLWENVPGALSSEGGEAFRQLLSEMDKLGYGLAWRVLDAQFFGVAQRRRRVFLVGRLGDPGGPCQVLFEPEGLRWDHQTSREKREALAARAGRGAAVAGGALNPLDQQNSRVNEADSVSPTLTAQDGRGPEPPNVLAAGFKYVAGSAGDASCLNPNDPQSMRIFTPDSCCSTLCSDNGGMNTQPSILTFAQNSRDEVRVQGDGRVCGALSASPGSKQQTYVAQTLCIADDNAKAAIDEDMCGSLKVGGAPPMVGL